jgi:CRISP-associated protein Cas1
LKQHLNTLFILTQGAYLAKKGETVVVRVARETRLQMPLHNLGGIVCFGQVRFSPFLLGACGKHQVALSFLTEQGRFLARFQGPTAGNVLLRREQYRQSDHPPAATELARAIVAAKVFNSRSLLMRAAREDNPPAAAAALQTAALQLQQTLDQVARADTLRGLEGHAARAYFAAFDHLILQQKDDFFFKTRSRRPPRDNVNALLSFLYTLLRLDLTAALECVGLDPAVGFLHRERPGRPSLALDLSEEFRSFVADRVALSLINLKQLKGSGFRADPSGGVTMDEETRKTVIAAYQKRKQDTITHPFLGEKTTIGLLFHLQALLLARYLRGDLDGYPPFCPR